ncbi:MAG: glycosyl hydrolase [Janthinobacterium lividum]
MPIPIRMSAHLLCLALLCSCSGGHDEDDHAGSASMQAIPVTGDLSPEPSIAGQIEVGAGIAGVRATTRVAAGSGVTMLAQAVQLAAGSSTALSSQIGIEDMETIADGIPGDVRIAALSTANPGEVLGRSAPNALNPDNDPSATRVKNVDSKPFATGKWSKGFFYQNPNRLDAYFQIKPVSSPDPRNVPADTRNRSIFAFPNKLWLDDRIGMVNISFPKRRFIPLDRNPDSLVYDLRNPYLQDHVLFSMEPDADADMRLAFLPDGVGQLPRQIDRFDELTVSTSWKTAAGDRAMQVIAAEGSPYVTVRYKGLRPVVQLGKNIQPARQRNVFGDDIIGTERYDEWENINQLVAVGNGDQAMQSFKEFGESAVRPVLAGTKFRFVYTGSLLSLAPIGSNDSGRADPVEVYKEAVLYSSSPITLEWNAARRSYVVNADFDGVLRTAYVNETLKTQSLGDANGLTVSDLPAFSARRAVLDQYASTYPLLAEVRLEYDGGASAAVSYKWVTQRMDGALPGANELMMMAFERSQLPSLPAPQTAPLSYPSNFGPMNAVLATEWRQTIAVPEMLRKGASEKLLWLGKGEIKASDRDALKASLAEDAPLLQGYIAHCNYESYLCGKYLNNIARLVLIADQLGDQEAIKQQMLAFLKQSLQPWFDGVDPNDPGYAANPIKDNFLFDTTNGGVITERGRKNYEDDYYNGVYTDHMFHYGYYIYASAVLGKFDSAWLAANREKVNTLVRDIANPSSDDPHFPVLRTYDWFRMQNFASSGPANNGPNTESASESIHANYAVMLWSVLNGLTEFQALAAVMTAAEIRTAQAYYQITPENSAFKDVAVPVVTVKTPNGPAPLALDPKNEIAVGAVYQDITQIQIYFGVQESFRVGIQLLPISPISEAVISRTWVKTHKSRLRALELKQTALFDSVINAVPNDGSPCFQAGYGGGEVNPGAVCASALQTLYSWRSLIASANGLSQPEETYARYLGYVNKVKAQSDVYQANTSRITHPGSSNNDGGVVADIKKTVITPTTDTNVLWWLATLKP